MPSVSSGPLTDTSRYPAQRLLGSVHMFSGPVENKAGNLAITRLSFQIFFTHPACCSAGANHGSWFPPPILRKSSLPSILGPRTQEVCVGTEFTRTMETTHLSQGISQDSIEACVLKPLVEYPAYSKDFGSFLVL